MMDWLERSTRLRQEAERMLDETGILSLLAAYGRIVPTGSYFLDLMVYPDIDLYLAKVSMQQAERIRDQLTAIPQVYEVTMKPSDDLSLPGGIYIKPRIRYGAWERAWKVDIWSLDEALIEEKIADVGRFQAKLTPALRAL